MTEGLAEADRGKLIMACGTGKTFTGLRIAEALAGPGKRVLFMVPSLALMSQTVREWSNDRQQEFTAFSACSDVRIGRNADADSLDLNVHDLAFPATTDPQTMDPHAANLAPVTSFLNNIYEGLVRRAPDMTIEPSLATGWELLEAEDGWRFTLRQGVKFHNGAELSSADVLWNWTRYMDPKTDWRCRSEFDGRIGMKVTGVTAPDPATAVAASRSSPTALSAAPTGIARAPRRPWIVDCARETVTKAIP